VVADAKTRPRRWARAERVPVGTCLYSLDVTISRIVPTSSEASRCGEVFGHDEWSSRSHPIAARCHEWNRDGDSPSQPDDLRLEVLLGHAEYLERDRRAAWPT